ncbi:MAG TPA: MlaE family lipid ABC transporter permease subunit [Stellaceae bacterium]|jgi:phospholipid/cholesterol/gamma-HCH transport system permease protein|nr:MlaE family lipid ABC transporter permease subunit [Stellaceae bacterium]
MQSAEAGFDLRREGDALVLRAAGRWLVASAAPLDRALGRMARIAPGTRLRIDLSGLERLDTVGAWLLLRTARTLEAEGVVASFENVPADFAPLLDQVAKGEPPAPAPASTLGLGSQLLAMLSAIGERTVEAGLEIRELLAFFGLVNVIALRTLRHPSRLRWIPLVTQMDRAGVGALPIIGLLSFLIGIVITFQGAGQLRRFGAEIFTVNLLGVGILRELGVLITAIIVSGRSGSAFTAEIGAMEVNEEIDAMRTLGLDPVELLVLPRLLGLVVVLPLLAAYADFMALVGGALMAWVTLDVSPPVFVHQLRDALGEWTLWVGLLKAPFFAATIALVGCHSGLRVSRSAESVGRLTTLSVVRSIFLVIIIDAGFSILYSRLGI